MPSTAFALTRGAAEETYHTPAYRYDNARRPDADSLVVQLTLAGEAFITGPEGRHTVPAGHAMLFTHREPTEYGYPSGGTEPYRLRFVAISRAPDTDIMFERIRTDFGRVVRLPSGSVAGARFAELYEKTRQRQFGDRFEEAELVYRFFIALYREQVSGTQASDPIAYGNHLLRDRFRQPININEVAAACGVSREHFIRGFSARYGEAPGALLRRLRLDYAQGMLKATELTVEDVAVASGFTSSNTFCRAYRQHFGHSPTTERS